MALSARSFRMGRLCCAAVAARPIRLGGPMPHRQVHTGEANAAQARDVEKGEETSFRQLDEHVRMLLIGSPGAGKGTQASRLKRDYQFSVLSSGDILRRNVANHTTVGQQAAAIMTRGELVPDDIMIQLISNELANTPELAVNGGSPGWVLDGFPRNRTQAEALDKMLVDRDQPLNMVVNIQVRGSVILERILQRWVHVPSGRVYNLSYNPPRVPGRDDVTGELLEQRPDDSPEAFYTRLRKHHEMTLPLLDWYDQLGILVELRGETSDVIYRDLKYVLAKRFGGSSATNLSTLGEKNGIKPQMSSLGSDDS